MWDFLFLQFALHRCLVLSQLGAGALSNSRIHALALAVGFSSDVWGAFVLGLLIIFLPRRAKAISLLFVGFLLAGHIPYVDFFHVTFRRLHLEYLFDSSFLQSSFSAVYQIRSMAQFAFGVAVSTLFVFITRTQNENKEGTSAPGFEADSRTARISKTNSFTGAAAFVLALGFSLLCNFISTKYSRKFDISDRLSQNVVISFLNDSLEHQTRKNIFGLKSAGLVDLKKELSQRSQPALDRALPEDVGFLANGATVSQTNSKNSQLQFLLQKLQPEFSSNVLERQQRYLFVFLMESSRAVESHLLFPNLKGHMPHLDSLISQNSIAFTRGFSTGTVSRSGAESTVCNSLSSVYFNAMRNSPLASPQCAPEIWNGLLSREKVLSSYFWVHGGYPTFDGQGDFWTRNQFQSPINILSMNNAPTSGWGLSDKAFFGEASRWLLAHSQRQQTGLTFASFVNISNHTAWHLPEDASPEVRAFAATSPNPNWSTTRYADEELARFVEQLKQKGIWEKSVVVFVGDHGMEEPSELPSGYYGFGNSPEQDRNSARLLTNVYFALSGGLLEQKVQECRNAKLCPAHGAMTFDHAVSQADLLPTFSELLSAPPFPFFGVSLFHEGRKYPVFADVGDHVFVPGATRQEGERIYSKPDFFAKNNIAAQDIALRAFYMMYLFQTQSGEFSRRMRSNSYQLLGKNTQF